MTTIAKLDKIADKFNTSFTINFEQKKMFFSFSDAITEDYEEMTEEAEKLRDEVLKVYNTSYITYEDQNNDFSNDTLAFEFEEKELLFDESPIASISDADKYGNVCTGRIYKHSNDGVNIIYICIVDEINGDDFIEIYENDIASAQKFITDKVYEFCYFTEE